MIPAVLRRLHDEHPFVGPVDSEIARLLISADGCHPGDLGPLAHLRAQRAPQDTVFLSTYRRLLDWGWMLDRHPEYDSRYILVFDPVRSAAERNWQDWCRATDVHPWNALPARDRLDFSDIAVLDTATAALCVAFARTASLLGTTWTSERDVLHDVQRTLTYREHAPALLHLDYPERVLEVLRESDETTMGIVSALSPSWTGTLPGLLACAAALQQSES